MERYIAFGLYQKNDQGGHQLAIDGGIHGEAVYLAAQVDALLKKISDARLDWGMVCSCHCAECERLDAVLRGLMGG